MKPLVIIIIILLAVGGLFYFSKPTDTRCREEAMKIVTGDLVKVPGYSDPGTNNTLSSSPQPDKIVIKDHVLWKDISYIYPGSVKKIGKAYLGNFHVEK